MVRVDPEDVARAKAGDRAACGRVVESMEGLVVQIAGGYAKSSPGHEMADLIQEGRIVVMSAPRWFRPELGIQFNTYAAECVRRRLYAVVHERRQRPLAGYEFAEDQDHTGSENAPADAIMDPASDPARDAARDRLADLLGRLDILSRLVVRLRAGLAGENPMSWTQIGQRLGMTHGAARRLCDAAMARLRGEAADPTLN